MSTIMAGGGGISPSVSGESFAQTVVIGGGESIGKGDGQSVVGMVGEGRLGMLIESSHVVVVEHGVE